MAKKKKSKSKTSNSTKVVCASDFNVAEAIASALSGVNQSILKVCRLCESKDGPFHNIFDSEKVTAKKIDELMPFWIAENDDLPHKICFRCSAKVEELYEFVQKCVGTQESLRKTIGKTEPLPMKKKTRDIWEQSLNKSNKSNDDICHELIKKAMEGIKGIVKSSKDDKSEINISKVETKPTTEKEKESDDDDDDDIKLDKLVNDEKNNKKDDRSNVRPLRSNRAVQNNVIENGSQITQFKNDPSKEKSNSKKTEYCNVDLTDENKAKDCDESSSKSSEDAKPFNIMDQITMIKVNGVGVLFQCKLCNRNFLKKEVVLSHGCAKTGIPKIDKCNLYIPPEPPKPSTVKYINTRISADNKPQQIEPKPAIDNENSQPSNPKPNVKKKIGPASKTGRRLDYSSVTEIDSSDDSNKSIPSQFQQNPSTTPQLNFMTVPNLSSRYKLLPGPNNTFTLVEDKVETDTSTVPKNSVPGPFSQIKKNESSVIIDLAKSPEGNSKNTTKLSKKTSPVNAMPKVVQNIQSKKELSSAGQPYPVGLFQTNPQAPFTTPAMKKQSYTVVQTGNPNKLLISSKPKNNVEETTKKRSKNTKPVPATETRKEPFSVVLEDATQPKDNSFFTFINVDPLLQPSYVLPTNSIIQESQITTSTQIKAQTAVVKEKDKYTCNICGESFNREKKLSAHINAHYKINDDYIDDGPPKKRGKK